MHTQIFLTQSRLFTLHFDEEELIKIIRKLNVHKAHGHDDNSIRMIKICDKSILKIQPNHLIMQIYGKSLILYQSIKRMIKN